MKLCATIAAGLTIALTGTAMADSLTVATWGGTFTENQRKAVFDPFAKESGNEVLDAVYNGGLGQLRAMAETGDAKWDVIQMEAADLVLACEEGLIEPIDAARIEAAAALGDAISECGVGALGWSVVIGYNTEAMKQAPTGWKDFFDTATYPGKRALRRSPTHALEAALLADGVDKADVYKVLSTDEGIDRAFAKLDTIKGDLQWWEAGSQPAEWLASGNVVMSTSYVGRLEGAKGEGAPVAYNWNGSMYAVDSWAIVTGSEHVDLAYDMINYASRADAQAEFSSIHAVAPTNPEADALIPADIQARIPITANREKGISISDKFWVENLEDLTDRFNAWIAK